MRCILFVGVLCGFRLCVVVFLIMVYIKVKYGRRLLGRWAVGSVGGGLGFKVLTVVNMIMFSTYNSSDSLFSPRGTTTGGRTRCTSTFIRGCKRVTISRS